MKARQEKGRISSDGGNALSNSLDALLAGMTLPGLSKESPASGDHDRSVMSDRNSENSNQSGQGRRVEIRREKAGRGGKTVTTLRGFEGMGLTQINDLCAALRRHCGAGGAVKERTVELQGDHRDRVATYLRDRGWRPVQAGG